MEPANLAEQKAEKRLEVILFFFAAIVLVLGVISLLLWGLPAVAIIGLIATLAVFVMLLAYSAGL